ncbi:outer membrane murein-binding lipoprotein Lpp [Amorphus suaedae]
MVSKFPNVPFHVSAVLAGTLLLSTLAGCSSQPGAPLIGAKTTPPVPHATTGTAVLKNGYPNPLVDPVTVEGTPLTAAEQVQLQTDLEAEREAAKARANF